MSYDDKLSFIYRNPTKVVFGPDSIKDIASEARQLGGSKAIIVTDSGLIKTDLVERIKNAVGKLCVGVFSEVEPDSGVHIVNKGAEMAKSLCADVIVSVGGGSAIDTAKGIAIVNKKGGKLQDYSGINVLGGPVTPHIVIPTTAGTGSEVTWAAVIKDHEKKRKLLFVDNYLVPDVAILDPKMTTSMPKKLTAATGMDALCHAVESIHSLQREPITDAFSLHAIRLISEFLTKAVEKPDDLVARGQMLVAANLAGTAFSNAQVGLVHALAHSVGARFGVPHGVANSILLPHCIMFNLDECPDRYSLVAQAMGVSINGMSVQEAGRAAADEVWKLTKKIGLNQRLRDEGVPKEGLGLCSNDAVYDGSIVYNPKFAMDPKITLGVYEQAW